MKKIMAELIRSFTGDTMESENARKNINLHRADKPARFDRVRILHIVAVCPLSG